MFRKELLADWTILIVVAVILIVLYASDLKELIKRLLEWTFVAISFKLLIDYGALPKLKERFDKK